MLHSSGGDRRLHGAFPGGDTQRPHGKRAPPFAAETYRGRSRRPGAPAAADGTPAPDVGDPRFEAQQKICTRATPARMTMHYLALACDYDGTLAHHGVVDHFVVQ